MQVNAILSATGTGTQAGKKITTTISHLRQSQESKAEQLAKALNQFTTNTYVSTQINEIGVTDFTQEKSTPTIVLADNLRLTSNTYVVDVMESDINGSLLKLIGTYKQGSNINSIYEEPTESQIYKNPDAVASFPFMAKSIYDSSNNIKIYIVAPETTNYTALYQEVNITP